MDTIKHSRTRIAALSVVFIATSLALLSSRGDSPVVDEVPHIGAGYSYIKKGDMRLNPEHPPLVKDLAGLSLLTLDLPSTAFDTPPWTSDVNGQWNFGRTLIYESGRNPDTIKMVARLPMLIFFLLACYLVWRWSYERYGDTAALIAVILTAFSPTILAHARLVTTDMAATTGVLAATYFFVRFLRSPTSRSYLLASLSLGIALLCKFNTVLLGPYFIIVAFFYGSDGRLGSARAWARAVRAVKFTVLIGLAAFLGVVWPVYILHTFNYPVARQLADTNSILRNQTKLPAKIIRWSADKPVIRAAGHWALGLHMASQRAVGGNTIYWLGSVVNAGGAKYFPIVYFLKEPLAWWILVAMALTAFAFHRRWNTDEWIWLLWLAIYWAVSIRSTLNIGIRHLLPIYPFTIMLVAGRLSVLVDWLKVHDRARLKWFSFAIALLLGWYSFESVRVFPYYLTYFNQIAGGPSGGYRYVADSNLDWGQDAKRLGEYVRAHGISSISVDYFGWADPRYYLKDAYVWTTVNQWRDGNDFIQHNTTNGWIAISGTFLQQATYSTEQNNGGYRWLLNYKPEIVVGNSIFVYHIVR